MDTKLYFTLKNPNTVTNSKTKLKKMGEASIEKPMLTNSPSKEEGTRWLQPAKKNLI